MKTQPTFLSETSEVQVISELHVCYKQLKRQTVMSKN